MAEKKQSFVDGLHSDNEPAMQPDNTYRDAWNGNLIAYGGNRYSFESVKGNKVSFTIPDNFNQKQYQIIGWASFIDSLIVLCGNDQSSTVKPGLIGKITFNNEGTGTYSPLYYHQQLGLTKEHPIPHDGIVGKPENSNIRRIVWTDNNKPMRTMNVFDSKLNTHIVSGDLIVGKKYMVLTSDAVSFITHNGFTWAPGRAGDGTSQNVFTATGTTYVSTGANYKVIEYISIESLDVTPVFAPGSIFYKGWVGGGSLKAGSYQYAYQLESADGARTNWSYLSLPISTITSAIPTDQPISYALFTGIPTGQGTGKGIKLTIDNIDYFTYNKIRVAFVYSYAIGVYVDPEVFFYESVTANSIDFVHYGNEVALEIIDLDTLTTITSILDLVKTITTTKNFLFAANVGLADDPKIDLASTVQVKTIEYLLPSDLLDRTVDGGAGTSIAAGYSIFGHGQVQNVFTGNGLAYPYQWYESTGTNDTTDYVLYNGIKYWIGGPAGNYFKGIVGTTAITQVGTARAVAVIRIQKYTSPTTADAGNYKNIRIENDFTDFKSPLVSHYLKSRWRRETYREGIFFHGTKGQPNFVLFFADKTIPEQFKGVADTEIIDVSGTTAPIGFEMRLCEYNSAAGTAALRSIGLSFSNIDFQLVANAYGVSLSDLNQVIKGFSIVRVERDEQIISQGALWPIVKKDAFDNFIMSTNQIASDKYAAATGGVHVGRRPNYYMYHSPDVLAGMIDHNGISRGSIAAGDLVEIADYYDGVFGSDLGQGLVSGFNYYEKNYVAKADLGGPVYGKGAQAYIAPGNTINVGRANIVSMPGIAETFNNNGTCAAFAGAGAPYFSAIGERTSEGAEGILFYASTDETTYPLGLGHIDSADIHKSIVNWVRPKANLYGGNSESVKATHKYLFNGHYQALDSAFMSYMVGTADPTPSNPAQVKTAGIVNNVEVFGGDAFVCMFGFERSIREESAGAPNTMSLGQVIPIESNINENWRGYGIGGWGNMITFNANRAFHATEAAGGIQYDSGGALLGYPESFSIYGAYAGLEKQYFLIARPLDFTGSRRDEHLIMRSLEKIDGEIIDNWKKFLIANQKRVDSQFERITNIRAKGSRLFYWQMKGVGYLPISERQMQDSALGNAVQMGVGGIMERFDEIDFYYGNQHQMSLMESDHAFCWFDFRRKKVMRLGFGGGKEILSEMKGLDSFFQTLFDSIETEAGSTIFNSDSPFTGKGIVSYYDPRFKMGLMVFKYSKTFPNAVSDKIVEQDFAIGFSEGLDKYIGKFNLSPNHMISHNGHFLMTRQVRPSIVAGTDYALGDELTSPDGNNYVCILAYTSANPISSAQDPDQDPDHWLLVSQPNQVYVNWRNDIGKFFGIVRKWSITFIAKDPGMDSIVVDNMEAAGNDTAFTDVYIDNSAGNASDTNISSSNRNYKYFNGSWFFSLPLKNKTTRLVDHYLQVKLQVKNYVGSSITTSVNKVKRVFYIKSDYRNKK